MAEQNRHTRLQKLSGSGLEGTTTDVRGWQVRNSVYQLVGKVEELIVDLQDKQVRYLAIDLTGNDLDVPVRQILVPVGIAEMHATDDEVMLPGITRQQLLDIPEYDEDRFDTGHESSLRNVFGGLGASALAGGSIHDQDFYQHEHFDHGRFIRNRKA